MMAMINILSYLPIFNLCAHMALKAKIDHGILITRNVYQNIDPGAEKYFKRPGNLKMLQFISIDLKKINKDNLCPAN